MHKLTIIGAGTMGRTIALTTALADYPVTVYALTTQEIALAQKDLEEKVNLLIQEAVISHLTPENILANIFFTTDLRTSVQEASFIIEAIPEELHLKQTLYTTLETYISPDVIIASNTSGIRTIELTEKMQFPERFVITHFWNPAHLIPLVEIVPSQYTSKQTIDSTVTLLESLQKKVVMIQKEVPGFIGNRLQFALLREAMALLDEGIATKEDIDLAVTHGIGRRLPITGPLASADFTGLDVVASISHYLFPNLNNDSTLRPSLSHLVSAQQLGIKTGQGLYEWSPHQSQQINETREQLLIQFLKQG